MLWLFLSVCLYAFNNVLWKLFLKGEQPLHIISRRAIFTFAFALGATWVTQVNLIDFILHPNSIYVFIASLFGVLGLVLMVTFLKSGSLVQMAFYSLLSTGIAACYTYLFREESLTTKAILGSALMSIGYLVFCFNDRLKAQTEKVLLKQHLLLIGMTLSFSVSLLIQWESLKIFPPLAIICTQETTVLVTTSLLGIFFNPAENSQNGKNQKTLKMALMAVVIFAGIFAGTIGLKSADPFLASVTGLAVPILTAVSGGIVFRERLTIIHGISLVLMIAGGVFLL